MSNIQDRLQALFPSHYRSGNVLLLNADCMEVMKHIRNDEFELSCVDPPYGIGESGGDKKRNRGSNRIVIHEKKNWDSIPPTKEYYEELCRVSGNQIMFGANYYIDILTKFTCFYEF